MVGKSSGVRPSMGQSDVSPGVESAGWVHPHLSRGRCLHRCQTRLTFVHELTAVFLEDCYITLPNKCFINAGCVPLHRIWKTSDGAPTRCFRGGQIKRQSMYFWLCPWTFDGRCLDQQRRLLKERIHLPLPLKNTFEIVNTISYKLPAAEASLHPKMG